MQPTSTAKVMQPHIGFVLQEFTKTRYLSSLITGYQKYNATQTTTEADTADKFWNIKQETEMLYQERFV